MTWKLIHKVPTIMQLLNQILQFFHRIGPSGLWLTWYHNRINLPETFGVLSFFSTLGHVINNGQRSPRIICSPCMFHSICKSCKEEGWPQLLSELVYIYYYSNLGMFLPSLILGQPNSLSRYNLPHNVSLTQFIMQHPRPSEFVLPSVWIIHPFDI